MKRLMVVCNPRSSHASQVEKEVLGVARELKGWMIGKYEVAKTNVDDNAEKLAKVLNDGDLVVAAGGDGTATIAMNGVMLSGAKDVTFGVLGYGNFNDMSRAFGAKSLREIVDVCEKGKALEVCPLECLVNDKHWRYGMCYFTIGLFAEACAVFDDGTVRKKLRSGKKSIIYSLLLLAGWYRKNRKRKFLADFELTRNGKKQKCEGMTDYVAVNGRTMARLMRGGEWFLGKKNFLSETRNLASLSRMIGLMMPSIFRRVPGVETTGDVLMFEEKRKIMVQAEGEYLDIADVEKLEFRKARKTINAVVTRKA